LSFGCLERSEARDLTNVPEKGTIVPVKGTNRAASGLGTLLLGRTRLAILSLLLPDPTRRLHLREIIRLAGVGQGSVQRELAKLARSGVLHKTREGNHTYYEANRTCPVFGELQGLVAKTAGIASSLRDALLPLSESIDHAFLYGSVARGEEGGPSDIDLMVVGDVSFFDVVAATSPLQETLGREINPTVFSRDEFRRRVEADDHFVTHVMNQERTDLIGGDREP